MDQMTEESIIPEGKKRCACGGCNELIDQFDSQGRPKRFKLGHNQWRGGRHLQAKGYVVVYNPTHPYAMSGKYVFEHRLVMEQHLGRYLKPDEQVHHINGIRNDNRIENLELTNVLNHTRLYHHNKVDMSNRKCSDCGSNHTSSWWYRSGFNTFKCGKCYQRVWKINKKSSRD